MTSNLIIAADVIATHDRLLASSGWPALEPAPVHDSPVIELSYGVALGLPRR